MCSDVQESAGEQGQGREGFFSSGTRFPNSQHYATLPSNLITSTTGFEEVSF